MEKHNEYAHTVKKVGINTIIFNVIIALAKLLTGILGHSTALISGAIHSVSDMASSVIVVVGAKLSGKKSDQQHAYGHERFESLASLVLGGILTVGACGIGYAAVMEAISFAPGEFQPGSFTYLALFGALVSILGNGWIYFYNISAARRIGSTSLKADAWHHLSDSLSSIGSLLGVVGLMIGGNWAILDPIAGIVICVFILRVAFGILKNAVDQLVDKSIPVERENEMKMQILSTQGVTDIKNFKSRMFGNKVYVDAEVYIQPDLSFMEADETAEKIKQCLESAHLEIKNANICARPQV